MSSNQIKVVDVFGEVISKDAFPPDQITKTNTF